MRETVFVLQGFVAFYRANVPRLKKDKIVEKKAISR
jgi:hypothetical protein